jgi:uncharacterized protein DUF4350
VIRTSSRARRALPWLLLGGCLLLAAYFGRPQHGGPPLDPDSVAPDGTKALMEVLRSLDAKVDISGDSPDGATDTALLLADDLGPERGEAVLEWVRAGGVLVVADPTSPITEVTPAGPAQTGFIGLPLDRHCDLAALRDVHTVAPSGLLYEAAPGETGCFTTADAAWLLVQPVGAGTVVRLGGPGALTNRHLGDKDNGLLAVSLLAPRAGTRVHVLQPPPPGGGDKSLTDLIRPQVKSSILQLVVAFVVLALWRGRRLGKPVVEPQPVQIPASELVIAVGNLLQRAKGRSQASKLLADDLRRTLSERLGLPVSTPPERVAEVVAARTGLDRAQLERTMTTTAGNEAELVALAQNVEAVRRELSSVGR